MWVEKQRNKVENHLQGFRLALAWFSVLFLGGCATTWKQEGVFNKATQTWLTVESSPSGDLYVNSAATGKTPLTIPLNYEHEYARKNRKVSYWISQPGLAMLLTVGSLGLYLPFSLIPVDVETLLEPTSNFRGSEFRVRIAVEGYKDWEETLILSGQQEHFLKPTLTKMWETSRTEGNVNPQQER